MAVNNSRFDRSRDDPLAELARLIAQANSYPETAGAHEPYNTARSATAATVPVNVLRPGEDYGLKDQHLGERCAPPASGESHQSYEPQERGYEKDPPAARYFSGQARQFSAEADAHEYNEPPPPTPGHQLQGYAATSEPDHGYETDEAAHSEDAYAPDEYYDEAARPRRRGGLVAVAAIFSLAAVCTGGAFGYSAILGGSVLPTLPPITKASNKPIPVAPAYGDTQEGSGVGQTLAAASSSAPLTAPATASPGPVASAADFQWPAPPPMPAPQSPAAAAAPALTSPPAQVSEPKKIHTVTIRADQTGSAEATRGSTMPAPPAARSQSHAETTPRTSASLGQNGPLSIVPGGQGDAPAQRSRATEQPMTAASNNTGVPAAPSPAAGGGYAVQVTSESSEAGAQSTFRVLQVKYPNQLGGRTPIIRRADLGAKGIYYRAMVGPFASADQAAELCSNLKAVGGRCLVQKN